LGFGVGAASVVCISGRMGSLVANLIAGSPAWAFEETLQDYGCGDLVHDATVVLPLVAGLVEQLVGLVCGEPFIPKINGHAGELTEFCGKGLGFGALRTRLTGKMQRVADHDAGDGVAACEARKGAEVLAGVASALERHYGLGGQSQRVRHSNANAPVTDVEGEVAGTLTGRQLKNLLAIRLTS
jgi:hypothetical protein